MATKSSPATARKKTSKSDPAVSYDDFKEYEGKKYTGMKIGRSHKWYYDQGEWKEKKITPDLWQISYAVTKRRAGRAPEGSGVPVGTEYHWYILAHQNVRKLNANDYTTSLAGMKFKIAHRRADNEKWSATPKTQRKRMIAFLQDVIRDLSREPDEVGADDTPEPSTHDRAISAPPSLKKRPARRRQRSKPPVKRFSRRRVRVVAK
ncbi:MAG: hypothetical protein AB1762_04600 [Gemmatimonadota bacterium]